MATVDIEKPFFDAFPSEAATYFDALSGAVDSFYSFARDVLGLTSETETFTMPFIASGVGSVYWTDAEGARQVAQGNFLFSSAVDVGQTVFSAGGYTVSIVSGTGENAVDGGVTYFSSGSDAYWLTVPSTKAVAQSWDGGAQDFTGQSTAGGQAYAHRSTRPSFVYGQTPTSLPFPRPAFKLETSVYSSLRGDTTTKILLPASDRQVTLADVKIQMVDSYNITYPEATIPYDEIPDFDEWQEQQTTEDPTEPATGGGFVFDYNEVVSPSELVDILDGETYSLETVDDKGLLTAETLPQLPDATFSADGLSLIADTVIVGTSVLEELGLWVPLVAAAVVVVLLRVLK